MQLPFAGFEIIVDEGAIFCWPVLAENLKYCNNPVIVYPGIVVLKPGQCLIPLPLFKDKLNILSSLILIYTSSESNCG